jgi:catechol 2,3-dioxygenase-like lactoylglutathione lyase family enzyme
MMPTVITHRLALALRLSDATDGRGIEDDVRFLIDGETRKPMPKPSGHFIFTAEDLPETHFDLCVRASGYVPTKKRVLLEAPGIGPPLLHIEMIPLENPLGNVRFWTLSGSLEGLSEIDAVPIGENSCFAKSFDAKTRTLTVYNPYRIEFNRARYALLDPNGLSYESFRIESRVSDEAFKIDHPFVLAVSAERPVVPVVSGCVGANGEYLLRVRDEGVGKRRIVRFSDKDGERFELVEFSDKEGARIVQSPRAESREA